MKEKKEKSETKLGIAKSAAPLLLVLAGLVLLIVLGAVLISKNDKKNINAEVTASESSSADYQVSNETVRPSAGKQPAKLSLVSDDIYSTSAYLTDKDGNVLLDINSEEKLPPASLTKIMTAMIAIEKIQDLDAKVTIPENIFGYIAEQQASTAGFSPGETVSYRDLLYGVMLPSGAECCLTLAHELAGSEEQYVKLMNVKAMQLGMENTHFTNVCGLQDPNLYSTAKDISVLLNYSLKNDSFREVFTSDEHSAVTDMHPGGITLRSTVFSVMDSPEFRGGATLLGGKTGYTDEAGLCLASLCGINGEEYTLVTMGAKGSHSTEPFHIMDAKKIYETLANGGEPMPEEPTEPATESPDGDESSATIAYDGSYDSSYDEYTDYSYEDDNSYSYSGGDSSEDPAPAEPVTDPPEVPAATEPPAPPEPEQPVQQDSSSLPDQNSDVIVE